MDVGRRSGRGRAITPRWGLGGARGVPGGWSPDLASPDEDATRLRDSPDGQGCGWTVGSSPGGVKVAGERAGRAGVASPFRIPSCSRMGDNINRPVSMPPDFMTYAVLALLTALGIAAWRSYARFRQEKSSVLEGIKDVAMEHRWNFTARPSGLIPFRITGRSDDVSWVVEGKESRYEDAPSPDTLHWASPYPPHDRHRPAGDRLLLYVADRHTIDTLRGTSGKTMLQMVQRMESAQRQAAEVPIAALLSFLDTAQAVRIGRPALDERLAALTTHPDMANAMLGGTVSEKLQEWPEGALTLQRFGDRISIFWSTNDYDATSILGLIELGCSLVRSSGSLNGE